MEYIGRDDSDTALAIIALIVSSRRSIGPPKRYKGHYVFCKQLQNPLTSQYARRVPLPVRIERHEFDKLPRSLGRNAKPAKCSGKIVKVLFNVILGSESSR